MSVVENLGLVDEGIATDITSTFLHFNPELREGFCDVIDMVAKIAAESVAERGIRLYDSLRVSAYAREVFGDVYDNLNVHLAVACLSNYDADVLATIADDMRRIMSGEVVLSSYQRKAMSNLSNEGRYTYESILGIDVDTLEGPVLDIGAGEEANFALDLIEAQPEASVVSTSVHLSPKKSRMRRLLSNKTDRGLFVAADGSKLPFGSDKFKTVISVNAAPYYVPHNEVPAFIHEVHRVLQPLGATAILSPALCDYGNTELTQNELDGFDFPVELEDMPHSGFRFYKPDVPRKIITIRT